MDEFQNSDAAQKEEEILKRWNEAGIFQKTLAQDSPEGEFVFYEGPPTANGRPGIHHLIARIFKDVIPRYKTMRGFHVRRKAGWDTHGLPVEIEVEKSLGISGKKDIENIIPGNRTASIEAFNEKCKESVWKYIDEWREFTQRIGYWVDLDDAYITYYPNYIESVWNVIAHAASRDLLYKDYKVVPWCPRCGTALSSHELAQGYEDVKDISVYVKFKVVGEDNTYLLAWTTTPWTLPGNVGLAVGEDVTYVQVLTGGESLWLAKERLSVLSGDYTIVEETKGKNLVGKKYEPLFPYLGELITGPEKEKMKNAHQVYAADFVTTEDGTGIVHTAVMYGQDDFELGNRVGLPKFHLVNEEGKFIPGTGMFAGRAVRDESVAVDVIKYLADPARNLLLKKETVTHQYPHCWRCHTALIYYARDSWYIRMSALRDELVRENEKINWVPEYIKEGRFGEWLREVKDWAISRDRYWGTPLPVWECAACHHREVVGSKAQLRERIKTRGNTYTLVRHGDAQNNVENINAGTPEMPYHLTEEGKEQIAAVARKLKKQAVTKIYTSPFIRTKETADIIAHALGLPAEAVVVDDRLRELGYGDFNGGPRADFLAYRDAHMLSYTDALPNGESSYDVKKRMAEFLHDTAATFVLSN
jgi:isoleucyl-tRNA synthetase